MLARVWLGVTRHGQGRRYLEHLQRQVSPELIRLGGYRGMEVLRREVADGEEFVVTTYWENLDAVRLFAGDDAEQAVVTPAARALMVTCGERASHYDVEIDHRGSLARP
jgi:heme-degrading monooxygenase HmoA